MILSQLQSIANKIVDIDAIFNPDLDYIGYEPFSVWRPLETILVNLLSGTLTPDRNGDDVERFYKAVTKIFHLTLKSKEIPLRKIECATITITPEGKQCIIIADGKTFKSHRIVYHYWLKDVETK